MSKLPISVFIITLNEENNIARALRSVQFAEEIVVVDSGSTDGTLDIIRSFGIEPIHNDWPGYAKQKQFAMDLCSNDWVLNLDADEEITSGLANCFAEVIKENKYSSVRCERDDYFIGKSLSSGARKPRNTRFYRKSVTHFDTSRLVHESATVVGEQLFVAQSLLHYGYSNISICTDKKNQYSSLKAKEKYQKGKRFSYLKLLLIFPLVFIQDLIFKRRILLGTRGLILSVIQANYAFTKEAKLFELAVEENNTSDNSNLSKSSHIE